MRVAISITVDGTSSDGVTIEHLGVLRQDVVPSAFDGTTTEFWGPIVARALELVDSARDDFLVQAERFTAYASAADDEEKKKE